ncbi:MAG: Stk1 family PASTA domain-containing Ser/Thr kinase, partial [Acidimicrobiales bacterium]
MAEQQVFSDRYELVRHIARGGMAQVYLAKDLQLDRHVALKVLFPELSVDRSFVERFRREAQAAASLSHPNIVSVYDWGQGERTYFIVMEYIDGHTLSSLIRQGPFDADRAAVIGSEVAAALQFAHGKGVIHRDVKPGNVLLDRAGQVKVTDFGIARAVGAKEGLTQTGSVMGTATYFSPEQAQGFAVDARSDVYSLGIVLYEMVVGKPPFAGDNPVSIAYKHVREEPVAPRVANPAVPPAFDSIVMKAMAKDAGERYPTAGELRDDLLRFHHGEAVTAGYAATTVVAPAVNPTRAQPRTAATVDTYERRSYTGLVVALVVLLLAVLGALAFFLTRSNAKTLSIPSDLVGKPVAAAQTELTSRGFTNVATTHAPSDQVAQGLVISTNPPVGTSVKTNAAVTLVVSTGAAAVTVPNVVNQDQQSATNTLASSGFNGTVTTASSDQVAQGLVISTNPPAGTSAAKGSTVAIVVST